MVGAGDVDLLKPYDGISNLMKSGGRGNKSAAWKIRT